MQVHYINENRDITSDLKLTSTYFKEAHTGSARYDVVNTGTIVEHIKNNTNYVPVYYKASSSKKEGTQAYMIRFRPEHTLGLDHRFTEIPELCLLNSYDTTNAFKLYLGTFRIACLNGLIAGDIIEAFRHSHINFDYNALSQYLDALPGKIKQQENIINEWKNTQLNPDQCNELATKALVLRGKDWDYYVDKYNGDQLFKYDCRRIQQAQRAADLSQDLWTTFNRLQERVINGSRILASPSLTGIKSVTKQVELTRKLFDIASQYATI